MSRALLVTGATGKQGGAVITALLKQKPDHDFSILAVTRDANSASARKLAAKSPSIKLVQGNLDDVPALFTAARSAASNLPIWGVYSVQVPGKNETAQGKALIDESLKAGVRHFVYSSVDRGGDEHSWTNPTPIPHFKAKHQVEHHLRNATVGPLARGGAGPVMGWTILRPVAFMDNLQPGFPAKVFVTTLRDTLPADKSLQWVAVRDVGFFGAAAFLDPEKWNMRAVGLAGDELTYGQLDALFQKATGKGVGTTFGLLGRILKMAVEEVGTMVDWFRDEGYGADIAEVKRLNPETMSMEAYLKDSAFVASPQH